jgi:hypothetical protein
VPIVRRPPHPFWLRRQVPFVRIEASYQSRLDPRLSGVRSIRCVIELGCVGDLSAPGLSTAKPRRTARLPQDRREPVRDGAYKIPLPSAEMPGARNEDNPLVEAAKLDAKPAFVVAAHIGANYAGGNVTPI